MTGIPESGWLYARGPKSVRLVREEESNRCRLIICGPGTDIVTQEFANVAECMKRQGEIEQELVAGGYQLAQLSSDRRKEHGSWQEVGSTSSSELTCSAGEARPEHTTSHAVLV